MSDIWYSAVEKFSRDSDGKESWEKYVNGSKLFHLKEVISLDPLLCPPIVQIETDNDWDFVVNEDYMTDFFTDLSHIKQKLNSRDNYNLLAIIREPDDINRQQLLPDFKFIGFDLMDREMFNSALTNCGGFDETFKSSDLNLYGLVELREKAYSIRDNLKINNPGDHHADCWVFEIWKKNT